jgi:hypothetical protein
MAPAPQLAAISSMVAAPCSISRRTRRSDTPWHWHTTIAP